MQGVFGVFNDYLFAFFCLLLSCVLYFVLRACSYSTENVSK